MKRSEIIRLIQKEIYSITQEDILYDSFGFSRNLLDKLESAGTLPPERHRWVSYAEDRKKAFNAEHSGLLRRRIMTMNKEEMEKKRDELQIKRDESFQKYTEQISHNSSTYSHFVSGWNACAEEYEKYIADLRTGITSLNNKILEQKVAIENVKEKLNKATKALEEAAEYHNTDDVNGEAGYIAWKALKEIRGE